ncbi:DUF6141 family protein [Halococcus salsus]|uniref:DUF6141 family protein n=1 Tax=Halococcus salsus TaxID=2162894 RepID=UPI0013588058|nr:DUF6141 family protein [Halococcus salsus]
MTIAETYRETQRFGQLWVWVLIGGVGVVSLIASAGLGLVVIAAVAVLFYLVRLTTEVREDGVYVRFAPLHRSFRHISFDEVERCEVTDFGLLTYGGIGIRWTPSTIAYMTTRGRGVKLYCEDQKSVVIGSQRADELATAITKRM